MLCVLFDCARAMAGKERSRSIADAVLFIACTLVLSGLTDSRSAFMFVLSFDLRLILERKVKSIAANFCELLRTFAALTQKLTNMELQELTQAIVKGDLNTSVALSKQAIEAGVDPKSVISDYLIKGMEEIGARFGEGKAFVPNLLMSARAMKGCLDLLKPLLKGDTSISCGKVVIGTVKGDLHDIGKNLVASMFEGSGFEVINLGINVEADKFVEAVRDNQADILGLSALLTTTMGYMKDVVDAITAAGLRDKVKVMVGGAPLNAEFAAQVGADIYTADANEAVLVAKRLVGKA